MRISAKKSLAIKQNEFHDQYGSECDSHDIAYVDPLIAVQETVEENWLLNLSWAIIKSGIFKVADLGEYLGSYLQPIVEDVSGPTTSYLSESFWEHKRRIQNLTGESRQEAAGPGYKIN